MAPFKTCILIGIFAICSADDAPSSDPTEEPSYQNVSIATRNQAAYSSSSDSQQTHFRRCDRQFRCTPMESCPWVQNSGYGPVNGCGWAGPNRPYVCCPQPIRHPNQQYGRREIFPRNRCAIRKPPPPSSSSGSHQRIRRDEPVSINLTEYEIVTNPVVGGVDALPGEFPWMAAIFVKHKSGQNSFICGGSLVAPQWILSAGHCFLDRNSTQYFIRLGDINLHAVQKDKGSHGWKGIQVDVYQVFVHPNFNYPKLVDDIALLKLSFPLPVNEFIRPVCLPPLWWRERNPLLVDSKVTVSGWGIKQSGGVPSELLQYTRLQIVSNRNCNATYAKKDSLQAYPGGMPPSVVCAGSPSDDKDACQGDSGGPLVFSDAYITPWNLVGIVSGGIGCATPGVPGVYTRVSFYVDWVYYVISANTPIHRQFRSSRYRQVF